jgi:sec-independent protein translocase protein TatA
MQHQGRYEEAKQRAIYARHAMYTIPPANPGATLQQAVEACTMLATGDRARLGSILKEGRMFGFGFGELLIVLLIVLVLFSRRLPELGEGLGKGIRKFRKSLGGSDEIDITPESPDKKDKRDKPG